MHAEQSTPYPSLADLTDLPDAPPGPPPDDALDDAALRLLAARDAETDHHADADASAQGALAALTVAASLGLGVVADLFFYGTRPGINLPLFTLLFLGVGFALLARTGRRTYARHLVFALPAVLGAALLSLRAAPSLILLNFLLLGGSVFVVVRFASEPRFLGGDWLEPVVSAFHFALVGWVEGPLLLLARSGQFARRIELERAQLRQGATVLRGLALTIPVVVVFGLLLSSADMVFGEIVARGLGWLRPANPAALVAQAMLIGVVTWGALAAFKWLLYGPLETPATAAHQGVTSRPWLRLSMVETSMMLGSVNTLFLAFMLIQARYLFGGEANITAQGYTYAEYARRGFWELLAVSCLTMVLALVLDAWTVRKRAQERAFRWLVTGLVGLTLLLLVAAYYRLHLYEAAYGFTRIRVSSGVFMGWLGVLLLIVLASVWAGRRGWFWPGACVVAVGFVLTLNVINLDAFIARQNIARFEDGERLDIAYLLALSDDAVPVLADLLDHDGLSETQRTGLRSGLGERLWLLDRDRDARHVLGYHAGRAAAWRALDARRAVLADDIHAPYRYSSDGAWSW